MKTLSVGLDDLEGVPHGTTGARTQVEVTAAYTSDVVLASGRIVPRAIKAKPLPAPSGTVTFSVYESDSDDVAPVSQGFAIRVTATLRPTRGGSPVAVTRTVKVLTSTPTVGSPAVVHLGSLEPAEGLPRGWVTVAEMQAALDEQTAAAQQAAAYAEEAATRAENALLAPGALPVRYTNLLTDPTYQVFGTAGWSFLGGTAVRSGNDAVVTGNGTLGGVGLYTSAGQAFTGKAGHRYHVRAEMTVEADSPASPSYLSVSLSDNTTHVYVTGAQAAISSPGKGTRYTISGIVELPADYEGKGIRLYQRAFFPSAAAANGAKVRLHPSIVFDLTAASPTMPEPSLTTLNREVAAAGPVVNRLDRGATTVLAQTFQHRRRRSVAAGPHVVLRFDDGYVNNLTVAAPIMARYGYVGTLFTGTHPTEWLGGSHSGQPLMTPAQLRELHEVYGWEIGSHTRRHDDAINTPLAEWVTNIEASIDDLIGYGLPRPRSFAYPNGSRTASTDRFVYGLFDKCGITGGPERAPWPYDLGTFFTGWSAIGGANDADADRTIVKAKRYVESSFREGRIPILGFHGITLEQPTLGFFLRADKFAALMQWLWDEGYPVSTMSDTPDHNLIADPGFEDFPVSTWAAGSHPWGANSTTGWTRTNAVPVLGSHCMRLDAPSGVSSLQWFEQRISVRPGVTYRVRVRHSSPTVTAGDVRVVVYMHDILGTQVGAGVTVATIAAAATAGEWVRGEFTVPAGVHVARLNVQAAAPFAGDARIEHVACYPSDAYDPLAP